MKPSFLSDAPPLEVLDNIFEIALRQRMPGKEKSEVLVLNRAVYKMLAPMCYRRATFCFQYKENTFGDLLTEASGICQQNIKAIHVNLPEDLLVRNKTRVGRGFGTFIKPVTKLPLLSTIRISIELTKKLVWGSFIPTDASPHLRLFQGITSHWSEIYLDGGEGPWKLDYSVTFLYWEGAFPYEETEEVNDLPRDIQTRAKVSELQVTEEGPTQVSRFVFDKVNVILTRQ